MECCGRTTNSVELQVAGQPFDMRRCGVCDTTYWTRDGALVDVAEVTGALRDETDAAAAAGSVRRGRASGNPG